MEQIASQIIGPVVNILTGRITKHLEHVTSSTKRVADMIRKTGVLNDKSIAVNGRMERNKRNRREIPPRVEGWLRDVENVKDEVQSISSDINIGCLHVKKRYRAGRNALKTIEKIERLINEEEKMSWSDAIIPLGRVDSKPSPSSKITQNDFKSRDKAFKDALKYLQQDDTNSQVLALCGMGGVGKTTMMEQLKKVAHDNKMFNWIVKSVVGQNLNMLSVQNDIVAYLEDCNLPNASKSVRADYLCEKFKKLSQDNKKVLIILDDVWEKIELKDIGLTSPLPKGVKVLLTSREYNICKQIAVDANSDLQVVKVDVLEEAEAHNFFSGITGVLEEHDPDKYHIGCGIVKKCGYLPLAIKLIALTLKSEEISIWRSRLNCLNNNDLDKNVQQIIKISYERIEKDEECKAIFLHCGLFPEDANISIEDLTRHAWGLKLLKNVSTLREARDKTKTCVQKLIHANLLINGDHVGCVKMHDLVLAFVVGRVSNGDPAWIINHGDVSKWGRDEMSKSYKKMSLTCRGLYEFPREFKYPNVDLLLLLNGDESLKFSENFYENMEHLQVIAYYQMSYPLLSRSLKCSTNLKALCLRECRVIIDDCSFIGNLVNLEVLSFAHCAIRKLPATIANLRKLKLLDLTGCGDLHIDDGVFKNLVSLEELYMRVSQWKAFRFTNASFEELKMLSSQLHALEVEFVEKNSRLENFSFKKLDKFKISIGCQLEEYKYNEKYSYEKTLKLVTECSSQLQACKINEMFTKTEHLHLQVNDMIGLEDISIRPYGQRSFCSLIELEFCNCVNLIYLFPMSVASGLKKLERLTVLSCSVLKALVKDDRREINSVGEMTKFENLKFLSLKKLPELEILFSIENEVELPQLVELEVEGLPNFTSIYPDKNNSLALLNNQVRISKLEVLSIDSMENLKQIWGVSSEEDDNNSISTVRKIRVGRCDSLVNLFPSNPMRLLDHLESLSVVSCGSMEVIFNIDLECIGQVELVTNSSLRSISVAFSEKVRKVWRIKGGENNYPNKLTCAFEALEEIEISCCKRFRNIFTPTNTNCTIDMPALTRMRIVYLRTMNWQEEEVSSREERGDSISTVAFPSNLIHSFHNLQQLSMDSYDGVDAVFEMESSPAGGRELVTTTNNQQPLLPNLQHLQLNAMHSISHVWKCSNWKRIFILQKQSSFQNLTTICIVSCNTIKYLFSPLMAKLLLNLKKIDITGCEGMEEIVSNRDVKDEKMTTAYTTTTFFPHLRSLSFSYLKTLKRIGGGVGSKSSTGITTHDQFESSHVTTTVPWSLCQYSEDILIDRCESLMEVFETEWTNNNGGGIPSISNDERNSCIHNTSLVIPRPENIYVPGLVNLKKLVITSCKLLKHVFTFSTLGSLKQLEELMINKCEAMEVVVKKDIEEQRKVDFPRLESLELKNLPNLEGFFLGMNDFNWPFLEKVVIDYCPKMMVFTSGQSTAPKLKYIHTSLGKHNLECGLNFHVTKLHQNWLASSESASLCLSSLEQSPWSFHNLIELHMESNYDMEIKSIIPSNELLQLRRLKMIQLKSCYYVEEVFDEPQNVVEIPNLKQVGLQDLDNLKYIWKSNHHARTVLEFPNLTTMSIDYCKSLEHLFTSSMVGSLQQLQHLHISDCPKMEVIVKVEEEIECDAEVKEIVLPCLESLKLKKLNSLKGFCLAKVDFSWPSLHTLEITGCPELTVFSKGLVTTQNLNIIDTTFGRCYIKEDLNSFIKTKHHEGFQL